MRLHRFCGAIFIATSVFASTAHAQVRVEMEDLGSMDDMGSTATAAINNRGEVVGTALTAQGHAAFLWTRTGGFRPILENAMPVDINDVGQVIGRADCDFSIGICPRGFLWSQAEGFTDLGDFTPRSINNQGVIVGVDNRNVSFFWIRGEFIPTTFFGYVGAINSLGDVAFSDAFGSAAIQLSDGRIVPLDSAGLQSHTLDINDKGTVVGYSDARPTNPQFEHVVPIMWREGRPMFPNPLLEGLAVAVNKFDVAAGFMLIAPDGVQHAMAWDPTRGVVDLGTLDGERGQSSAQGINDAGEIVGTSSSNGRFHAVIWRLVVSSRLGVETPNTPSRWGINTRQRLAWTYDGDAPQFLIEVSREGGELWDSLATVANTPGRSQNFYWTVTNPSTTTARLRVTAIGDEEATDTNDAGIRIAPAAIEFVLPYRRTVLQFGTEFRIFWKHNLGARVPVTIEVSDDGGTSWRVVTARTDTKGSTTSSFRWMVDLLPTANARFRIRALDGSGASGMSEVFRVSAPE